MLYFLDVTDGEFQGFDRFCQVVYPCGKAGELQIRRCQGIAVDDYGFTLGALAMKRSGFCNDGVKMAVKMAARRSIIAGISLVLLLITSALALPGGLELRITPVRAGAPLMVLPLKPGEPFTVHYYHSVENAPIWEVHRLDPSGCIFIEEERYLKFGAGMGKMPGVGRMVRRGPYEVIENMHMPTGDFVLRIGSVGVDHTILWRGTRTNLSALAPHVAVQFSARPVPWLYAKWRWLFPHRATPSLNK